MREETKARMKRMYSALTDGWTREIRHPQRPCGNVLLMEDPNHPIR